ncbi:unnamed protein product [Periconia digitata]|uniref:Uncharacterized protein n=1 Tax=Periconia digitata TaxID=1303443 RepID=A0A9W4XKL0_9PLEO|nr:unnamed protein product [Periconia digitata]
MIIIRVNIESLDTPLFAQTLVDNYIYTTEKMATQSAPPPESPLKDSATSTGAVLQIDFAWSKFRNIVSEKNGKQLTPVYIQHFRPFKPQLRVEDVATKTQISTSVINNISIAAECSINGKSIEIKPLRKLKTAYNYLSTTLSSTGKPIPISWVATSDMKTWDFVCIDSTTQDPIAKLSANWWAIKQVGKFYFEQSAATLPKEVRDEVVSIGLTILYVMMTRMNNPFALVGAAFAKTGKVESDTSTEDAGPQTKPDDGTKAKQV